MVLMGEPLGSAFATGDRSSQDYLERPLTRRNAWGLVHCEMKIVFNQPVMAIHLPIELLLFSNHERTESRVVGTTGLGGNIICR